MYLSRLEEKNVVDLLSEFPVVVLLGARQVGKTSLAKKIDSLIDQDCIYLDMELMEDYNKLNEAELYLRQHQDKLVIIDEIQRKPDLFPVIRALVDEKRRNGRFLFLGSASIDLLKQSSETLAGRIYYQTLMPFNVLEVNNQDQLWLRGGFPDSYLAKSDKSSFRWLNSFITTYIERDLPELGINVPSMQLRHFWEMLAHNNGQTLNCSKFAANFGISPHTIRKYLSILEGTFLVRQLLPFSINISKRLVKTPKVYLRDTGLLHSLLRINSFEILSGNPIIGASYEGWVIEQLLSVMDADFCQSYFYRTHAGAEVDLLIQSPSGLTAIEIKRSISPKVSRGLNEVMTDLKLDKAYVVYPGNEEYQLKPNITAIPLKKMMKIINSL